MGPDPQNSPSDANGRRREAAANARERRADERERSADTREAGADRREEAADERERRIAAWETQVDDRERAAGGEPPSRRQRSYEQIDRIQKLLTASQSRLDRSASALRRADAGDARDQASIDRESVTSSSLLVPGSPSARIALEDRVRRLRQQAVTALETLSNAQHRLAHDHEEHGRPQRAAEHRDLAEQAREAADALRASAGSDAGRAEEQE
ncbi:hypothetical protein ABZV77_32695 [Streptomyces sp. NPDC004732]|uniref:hypothetical protein n=1 Tax=Streptomyces sp. NPDC004732 TaxID=3154290 RepID=UPI0033A6B6BF